MRERQATNRQNEQCPGATEDRAVPAFLYQALSTIWSKLEEDDLELLEVGLYHLFHNLNLLLQELIPQLAEISAETEAQQSIQGAGSIHSKQLQCYLTWLWLSEMKHRFERIEPLCQVLTITISHILSSVDTQESHPLQSSHQQRRLAQARQAEQQRRPLSNVEHDNYRQNLLNWQELNSYPYKLQAFYHLFTELHDSQMQLCQMDNILVQIYTGALSTFSSLLSSPEQPFTPTTATLLLLDLQQRADLLQLQIEAFLAPLHTLLKASALLVEMR